MITQYLIHTPILQALADLVIFIMLFSIAYTSPKVRQTFTEIREHLKQAYKLPYQKERKTGRWYHACVSGCCFTYAVISFLLGGIVLFLISYQIDLAPEKKLVGYAFWIIAWAVAFYLRVQADKAWHTFRHS